VENLVVFAPVVLIAHALNARTEATGFAAVFYFGARVAHAGATARFGPRSGAWKEIPSTTRPGGDTFCRQCARMSSSDWLARSK